MGFIFEIKDKSGRRIHLSQERWAHIQKHSEMTNQAENIIHTLQFPDKILQFEYDPKVRFYFKHSKERKQYLFVSVKYLNGEGFIITSFYTDRIE